MEEYGKELFWETIELTKKGIRIVRYKIRGRRMRRERKKQRENDKR
jgi:predicted alpha/beta-hydrolase family hydrolase